MSPAEGLNADTLAAALRNQRIGNCVIVLKETTSTNDVVAQLAPDHREGLVVIAEHQTAGRGQYGRRWESAPHKGLWFSVLLRPAIPLGASARLTELLALTIRETIEEQTGLLPVIKPPNDVYLADRKVAGVLVEMRVENNGDYCAIAGIGINVNQLAEEFPPELTAVATSLALTRGLAVSRADFLIALLKLLEQRYSAFRELPSQAR